MASAYYVLHIVSNSSLSERVFLGGLEETISTTPPGFYIRKSSNLLSVGESELVFLSGNSVNQPPSVSGFFLWHMTNVYKISEPDHGCSPWPLSRMKLIALHENRSMILLTQHSKQMSLYSRFGFCVHTEIDATVKCKTCEMQNKSSPPSTF